MTRNFPRYYILLDRTPIAVDLMTWGKWFDENENRFLFADEIDDVRVSTVFLGLDHKLFETMVFNGPLDRHQKRYCTYADAERGHAEAVVEVRKAIAQIKAIAVATGAT